MLYHIGVEFRLLVSTSRAIPGRLDREASNELGFTFLFVCTIAVFMNCQCEAPLNKSTYIIMKKTLWGIVIFLMMFTSCSNEPGGGENPKPEETPSITIDEIILSNGLIFSADGGEQSISITTNVDWTLNIANTTNGVVWCTASVNRGVKGTSSVKFTVEKNNDYEDRSVAITLKAGTASKTFVVTQKALEGLLVTSNKFEVPQTGGTINVEVKSNINYQLVVDEQSNNWLKENVTRALETKKHLFTVAVSEEKETREGKIYVISGDTIETIKIYQAGGPLLLLSQDEYYVDSRGGNVTIDVKSNIEFEVKMPDIDWITNDPITRGASSHTLKYTVIANDGYDSRTAEIVFFDKNSELKDTVKVIQAQKNAVIVSTKDVSVPAKGETIEVDISSNIEFETEILNADWISEVTATRGLIEHKKSFLIAENKTYDVRVGKIAFINKETKVSDTLTVTQEQLGALLLDKKEFNLSSTAERIEVKVNTNVDFEIILPENDWVVMASATKALEAYTVYLDIAANDTYDERKAEVIFKDKNSTVSDTLRISQAQKDAIIISAKKYQVDVVGGDFEVKLNSNIDFEVEIPTEANWITRVNTRALDEYIVKFTIAENVETESRSATIAFTNKESGISETVLIEQNGLGSVTQVGDTTIVKLGKAGTLEALLGDNLLEVTHMKICGSLNGTDVWCLRRMADAETGIKDDPTPKGKLSFLDLSEAFIVEGGGYYAWDYSTKADEIGDYFMYGSPNLKEIILPNSVTVIGEKAFSYCEALEKVEIPSSVTVIGEEAFNDCKQLKEVEIPNGVTEIGRKAFSACEKISQIVLPNSVETIAERAFENCTSLKYLKLPDNLQEIEKGVFQFCISLDTIKIPNGIVSIGENAFRSCQCKFIELPSSLLKVGYEAFGNHLSLQFECYCYAITPPECLVYSPFDYRAKGILYVPKGTLEAYQESRWKCANIEIIEMEE